eukprot:COSAG01_NODE_8283_length_2845_cov_1.939184_2_plen_89_part_00
MWDRMETSVTSDHARSQPSPPAIGRSRICHDQKVEAEIPLRFYPHAIIGSCHGKKAPHVVGGGGGGGAVTAPHAPRHSADPTQVPVHV